MREGEVRREEGERGGGLQCCGVDSRRCLVDQTLHLRDPLLRKHALVEAPRRRARAMAHRECGVFGHGQRLLKGIRELALSSRVETYVTPDP